MSVVMVLAIVAVLVAIFFAATGRGGELSREHVDYAPLELGSVSPADVALMRPPTALWGYNVEVTDEALDRIARAMRDRDLTIASLQEQLDSAGLIPVIPVTPVIPVIPVTPVTPAPATVPPPALPEHQALPGWFGPADLAGQEDAPGEPGDDAEPEPGL